MSPSATLSRKILTDILRGEMHFDGVIATNSMTMDGVAGHFEVNERNLFAVKAGVNIPKYVPGSKVYSTDENVYELGYDIKYDATAKDPNKTSLQEIINQAASLDEKEYTSESWDSTNELNDLKNALKTAENIN